jgi:hypothetical protein
VSGAGRVTGTVWNVLHDFDPSYGIKDDNLVYFDPGDLFDDGDKAAETRAANILTDVTDALDVTNEPQIPGSELSRLLAPPISRSLCGGNGTRCSRAVWLVSRPDARTGCCL